MKILRPVDVNKRLPEIRSGRTLSSVVLVSYNSLELPMLNAMRFSACNINGKWTVSKELVIPEKQKSEVTYWYEEVEIESLFPDDDKIYTAGENATNKQYVKTMFFQEGCSYFKNYILRMLK